MTLDAPTSANGPHIVGFGGTLRPDSTSERALRRVLQATERMGASTEIFVGSQLTLPFYNPESHVRTEQSNAFIAALRRADAVVIATPGYHGSISGLVKNAIDYIEDMRADDPAYLSHRAVGCIVSADGSQSIGSSLAALRSIIHALRGWPTPLGLGVNKRDSSTANENAAFDIMAEELMSFARQRLISGVTVS